MGFYEALLEPELIDGVEESSTVGFPDQQAPGLDRLLSQIADSTRSWEHPSVCWGNDTPSRQLSRIAH